MGLCSHSSCRFHASREIFEVGQGKKMWRHCFTLLWNQMANNFLHYQKAFKDRIMGSPPPLTSHLPPTFLFCPPNVSTSLVHPAVTMYATLSLYCCSLFLQDTTDLSNPICRLDRLDMVHCYPGRSVPHLYTQGGNILQGEICVQSVQPTTCSL